VLELAILGLLQENPMHGYELRKELATKLGTIRAETPPVVVLTSNDTRELSDALRRRCLHVWLDFPTPERELEIIRRRLPDAPAALAAEAVRVVHALRALDLKKRPSIAETLDWMRALLALAASTLERMTTLPWPGNVRQLRNAVERAVVLAPGGVIGLDQLPDEMRKAPGGGVEGSDPAIPVSSVRMKVAEVERRAVEQALADCGGNQSRAARTLGMSRWALIRLMRKYGIGS